MRGGGGGVLAHGVGVGESNMRSTTIPDSITKRYTRIGLAFELTSAVGREFIKKVENSSGYLQELCRDFRKVSSSS